MFNVTMDHSVTLPNHLRETLSFKITLTLKLTMPCISYTSALLTSVKLHKTGWKYSFSACQTSPQPVLPHLLHNLNVITFLELQVLLLCLLKAVQCSAEPFGLQHRWRTYIPCCTWRVKGMSGEKCIVVFVHAPACTHAVKYNCFKVTSKQYWKARLQAAFSHPK